MPGNDRPRRDLGLALSVAALGIGLAFVVESIPIRWVAQNRATLISAIWLYLPLPFVLWGKKPPDRFGISAGTGFRGLIETLSIIVLVLIPFYAVFFHLYPIRWTFQAFPRNLIALVVAQFLVIALPEEFFFRGFLQGELEAVSKKKWRILGAEVGYGWLAASFIFALGHIIILPTPIRAAVVFPALLFGWLRARTKSILFPAIMHATFNITFLIAQKMAGLINYL